MKWLRCNNAHRVIHKLTFVRDMNDTPAPMIAPFFETTKVTEVSTDSINFVASFRLLVLYCTVLYCCFSVSWLAPHRWVLQQNAMFYVYYVESVIHFLCV